MNINATRVAVAISISMVCNVSIAAEQAFPPNLKALAREWTQYVLSLPTTVNPFMEGPTDDRCRIGQHGGYWFLAGLSNEPQTTRTCTMPTRRWLFFPVVNVIDASTGETAAELLPKITPCLDAATDLLVELDGVPLTIGESNRVTSDGFNVVLPAGNLYGVAPQTVRPVVSDGYYVLLSPLDAGAHTLHVEGTVPGVCADLPNGFSVNLTYHLNVTAGTQLVATTHETEPNDACLNAQDLQSTAVPAKVAGYKELGGVDFFRFSVAPGTQLKATLSGDSSQSTPLQSTLVGVFSAGCTLRKSSSAIGASSSVSFTVPPDGTVIMGVSACCDLNFTGSGTLEGAYLLEISK
jgi:hypothetical protein